MKFDHKVKYKGKWYMPGEEIKEEEEDSVSSDFSKYMNAPVEKREYTRTEIYRLPTAELKALAKENGIDDSLNGGELKKLLIEKFGL